MSDRLFLKPLDDLTSASNAVLRYLQSHFGMELASTLALADERMYEEKRRHTAVARRARGVQRAS